MSVFIVLPYQCCSAVQSASADSLTSAPGSSLLAVLTILPLLTLICSGTVFYKTDGVHPSPLGRSILAAKMLNAVRRAPCDRLFTKLPKTPHLPLCLLLRPFWQLVAWVILPPMWSHWSLPSSTPVCTTSSFHSWMEKNVSSFLWNSTIDVHVWCSSQEYNYYRLSASNLSKAKSFCSQSFKAFHF